MELTLLAPTALSAACSKALAFCATAGSTAGPSTRTDIATNVTSRFLISLLPKSTKERKLDYHESPSASTHVDNPRRQRVDNVDNHVDNCHVDRPPSRAFGRRCSVCLWTVRNRRP